MLLRTLTITLISLAAGAAPASAAWLRPADLAPPNPAGQPAGPPALAVARDGTSYVAFQRFDGANLRVAVVTRAAGGGFGPPVDLSPAGADAASPAIAVDSAGNVTLAGSRPRPSSSTRARTRGRRLARDNSAAVGHRGRARAIRGGRGQRPRRCGVGPTDPRDGRPRRGCRAAAPRTSRSAPRCRRHPTRARACAARRAWRSTRRATSRRSGRGARATWVISTSRAR